MGKPVTVQVGSQALTIVPREGQEVTPEQTELVKTALRNALVRLTDALYITTLGRTLLDDLYGRRVLDQGSGRRVFDRSALEDLRPLNGYFDILAVCFMLTPPEDRNDIESFRRCLKIVHDNLTQVHQGLSAGTVQIDDLEPEALVLGKVPEGYVKVGPLERLSMWWQGDEHFHNFKSEQALASTLHLYFSKPGMSVWQATQTLIHEADHKYCRTYDYHYISVDALRQMQRIRDSDKLIRNLQRELEAKGQALGGASKPLAEQFRGVFPKADLWGGEMTVVKALNNADSYAYYAMWVSDN